MFGLVWLDLMGFTFWEFFFWFIGLRYDPVPILHLISSLGTILDYFPPSSFLISTYSFIPRSVSHVL